MSIRSEATRLHRMLSRLAFGLAMFPISPSFAQSPDPFISAPAPGTDPFRSAPTAVPTKPAPRINAAPRRSSTPELVLVPRAVDPMPVDPEVLAWQGIAQSTNASDFESYLTRYPQSRFSEAARTRLVALRPPPPSAPPTIPTAPTVVP